MYISGVSVLIEGGREKETDESDRLMSEKWRRKWKQIVMEARTCQICYGFLFPALRNDRNCKICSGIIPTLLWYHGSGAIIRPVNVGLSAVSLWFSVFFAQLYLTGIYTYNNNTYTPCYYFVVSKPKRVCLVNIFYFFLCKNVFDSSVVSGF